MEEARGRIGCVPHRVLHDLLQFPIAVEPPYSVVNASAERIEIRSLENIELFNLQSTIYCCEPEDLRSAE